MSTMNAMADAEPSKIMIQEPKLPHRSGHRFTAAEIEKDCPPRLRDIGREIEERLEEAREQTKRLDAHVIAINKLMAEAKELCDGGGFNKFRELFCPQLGKSQAYALRAVTSGKKTLAEHRTEERERKRKSRANQKAVAANSGTVPEKPNEEEGFTGTCALGVTNSTSEQAPEPSKPRSAAASPEAMRVFTVSTTELYRVTNKKPPEHFFTTTIPIENLAQLGSYLTALAALKKCEAVKPAPAAVVPGSGALSAELPADDDGNRRRSRNPRSCPLTKVSR